MNNRNNYNDYCGYSCAKAHAHMHTGSARARAHTHTHTQSYLHRYVKPCYTVKGFRFIKTLTPKRCRLLGKNITVKQIGPLWVAGIADGIECRPVTFVCTCTRACVLIASWFPIKLRRGGYYIHTSIHGKGRVTARYKVADLFHSTSWFRIVFALFQRPRAWTSILCLFYDDDDFFFKQVLGWLAPS